MMLVLAIVVFLFYFSRCNFFCLDLVLQIQKLLFLLVLDDIYDPINIFMTCGATWPNTSCRCVSFLIINHSDF
jgi:hypothetical protein